MSVISTDFLYRLLDSDSPSGFETASARIWREEASRFAQSVFADSSGNSIARRYGDGPRIMVEGHIDELGVVATHIDENGFIWFQVLGGWDPQVLVGQRIRFSAASGSVMGVIGKVAAHQLSDTDRMRASKVDDLWIDIGARSHEDAASRIPVGTAGVVDQRPVNLTDDLLIARGLDNRLGAFVALEVLRTLTPDSSPADVYAVASTQEEIGMRGSRTSAFALQPDLAIVIDVSHATDHPGADVRSLGLRTIGGGPVLTRGAVVHPGLFQMLKHTADREGLPWMVEPKPIRSATNADVISISRSGIPTALVKVPVRYMHSPNELISLEDVRMCVQLVSEFIKKLPRTLDLKRR